LVTAFCSAVAAGWKVEEFEAQVAGRQRGQSSDRFFER